MTTDTELLDTPATDAGTDAPAGDAAPAQDTAPQGEQSQQPAGDQPKDEAPKSALEKVLADEKARREATEKATGKAPAEAEAEKPAATDKPADGKPDGKPDDEGRLTKEEYEALTPKARRRFGVLTEQRNQARDALKAVQPVIERDRGLQGFLEQHSVAQEEFRWTLDLIAAVKRDPAKAYDMMRPLLADLQKFVGEALPEDLEADVTAGTISRERAQELSRARHEHAAAQARIAETAEAQRTEHARQQVQAHTQAVHRALQGWEAQWKGSDPDYAKKQPFVWPELRLLLDAALRENNNQPLPPEAVVRIAAKAKENIEARISGMMPARKPQTPVNGGVAAPTAKAPANALEAARLGLQMARQAA